MAQLTPQAVTQAERLRGLLRDRGWSQRRTSKELARRYGKTDETWRRNLGRWTHREHPQGIGDDNAERLAALFGVDRDYLRADQTREAERFLRDEVMSLFEDLDARLSAVERRLDGRVDQ